MNSQSLIILLTLSMLSASPSIRGDDVPDQKTKDRFEFLMRGIKDGRSRLVSGSYTASGDLKMRNEAGLLKIRSAFDYSKGLLRFDREAPYYPLPVTDPDTGKKT